MSNDSRDLASKIRADVMKAVGKMKEENPERAAQVEIQAEEFLKWACGDRPRESAKTECIGQMTLPEVQDLVRVMNLRIRDADETLRQAEIGLLLNPVPSEAMAQCWKALAMVKALDADCAIAMSIIAQYGFVTVH